MAQDVVITPASGKMEFFQTIGGSAVANIELNSSTSDLSFQTTSGNLIIGDASRDVYIGDGINSVDIVFEQSGEIRGLTSKTLTLGQSDSIVNFNTSKTTFSAGNVGIGTSSPSAKLHIESTTEQLRLGYNSSNYISFTVNSAGSLTIGNNYFTKNASATEVGLNGSNTSNITLTINSISSASRPSINIVNPNVDTATASNGKTFYGWLPIAVGGVTKWIQLYT